jgi:acylphosphatase
MNKKALSTNFKNNPEQDRMVRVHIFVSGRVQGVFFRDSTRRIAEELGIFGWVKNLNDGRVEAVLEGEKEIIQKLIEWTKRGPIFARVDKMKIEWEECKEEFKNFEIKYD